MHSTRCRPIQLIYKTVWLRIRSRQSNFTIASWEIIKMWISLTSELNAPFSAFLFSQNFVHVVRLIKKKTLSDFSVYSYQIEIVYYVEKKLIKLKGLRGMQFALARNCSERAIKKITPTRIFFQQNAHMEKKQWNQQEKNYSSGIIFYSFGKTQD